MEPGLNYNNALAALQALVRQIEGDEIPLDMLAAKVAEANELILYCEQKLRSVTDEVSSIID